MQYRLLFPVTFLTVELDQSFWIMWTVQGMRQSSLTALTGVLVSITVFIGKMQESSVQQVWLYMIMNRPNKQPHSQATPPKEMPS